MTDSPNPAAHSTEAALVWPRRILPLALTILVGTALSVAAFALVQRSEKHRVESEFDWRTRSHIAALESGVQRFEECLYTLRDLYYSTRHLSEGEFRDTASDLRQRHPGIQLLEWIPLVKRDERNAFEAANQKKLPGYEIRERNEDDVANVRSGDYPEYAPVLYADPMKGNEIAFGFDAYRGSHQRAIFRARDTGKVSATRRLPLREPTGKEFGWVSFLALYTYGPEPKTIEERHARLRGYMSGAFRLSDLVAECITDTPAGAVEALFLDETPGGSEPYLIGYTGGNWQSSPPPTKADFESGLYRAFRVKVGGRDWRVYFRPSAAWLAAQATPYSYAALGGGLLLTGLLGSLIFSAQRRTALVTRLVGERTAELRATQETLRQDIRRRETVEQALRESDDRYRAFVAQSTEAIWRFEYEPPVPTHLPVEEQIELIYSRARLAECNDLMAQRHGLSRSEEILGARLEDFASSHDARFTATSRTFIEGGYRLIDWETHRTDKEGNTKFYLNNATGILEDGLLKRAWGTQRDITERKRNEEQQQLADEEKDRIERKLQETQKLESLGVLAGGIAHDFNNLLTGILGNASLARMDLPENSPVQPSLEQIELAAQRAADLCRQMLAYSGKGRFLVQRLDLNALVRDTADLVQLSVSKNAALKFSLAENLPAINADATQIRQIIMNLVINASEAFGEKNGLISISTGVMHADRAYLSEAHLSPNIPEGEYVFLEVSDNGAGMDAETKARIFDPFFTTKFTGRGLGLAAVLGIVRGHSGALKVSSEPGRGTTFKLLLPRAEGPPEPLDTRSTRNPSWRGSGTVLVVDDEDPVRIVSARMLEAMGFAVRIATNGSEALDIFQQHRAGIAAVLLDLTMPQLDGAATFTELRRLQPEIPVLLMSGFNEQDAVNRFAVKGLAGFIQKPFKPETLQAKLKSIFEEENTRQR